MSDTLSISHFTEKLLLQFAFLELEEWMKKVLCLFLEYQFPRDCNTEIACLCM